MSVFARAGRAEILRSSQKDELYIQHLSAQTSDVFRNVFGVQKWLKYRRYLNFASDLAYYSLTTLSGLQTLGEEYVNIIQTNSTLKQVPTLLARVLTTVAEISCPFVINLVLKQLQKELQKVPNENTPQLLRNVTFRQKCTVFLNLLTKFIPIFQKLHSVLFYLNGNYYHVSKRLFSVKYVLIRSWLFNDQFQNLYRMLGFLTFLQLALGLAMEGYSQWNNLTNASGVERSADETRTASYVSGKDKCSLCLSKREASTATPCGHLFCWKCITEWLDQKKECPLCREKFTASRVVCLQNFE